MTIDQLYDLARDLPKPERLRLIERLAHDLADGVDAREPLADGAPPRAVAQLIGMWGDEPDAVDGMVEAIMSDRELRALRA
jgi:hypothetical protein